MEIFFLPLIPPRNVLVMGELKKGNGNVGVIYQLKLPINQQDHEKRKCRERRGYEDMEVLKHVYIEEGGGRCQEPKNWQGSINEIYFIILLI